MDGQDPPNGGTDDHAWQNNDFDLTAPPFLTGGFSDYDVNSQVDPYPYHFSPFHDPTGRPSQLSQFHSYSTPQFVRNSQPFDFQNPYHGLYTQFHEYPEPPILPSHRPTSHSQNDDHELDRDPSYHSPSRAHPGNPVVLHQPHPPNEHIDIPVNFKNTSRRVVRPSANDVILVAETGNGRGGAVSLAHRVRPETLKTQKEDLVVESAGAASRRKTRHTQPKPARGTAPRELSKAKSTAGSSLNSSPKPTTTYLFVSNSTDDPNRRGKKPPTQEQKLIQEQMVEIGGACIYCSEKRKICDLLSTCAPCQQAKIPCVRGKGDFYLFEPPALHSVDKGSYKKALAEAKKNTFKRICAASKDLPATIQPPHDPKSKIVLQVATNPTSPEASKHLELLYTDLFDYSHERRDDFSSKLVQTLRGFTNIARPSCSFDHLTRKEPFGEQKLLRLIESATIDVSIIERLQHAKVYSAVDELPVAIRLGSLVCGSLVKDLAVIMDDLCDRLRERLRHKKGHYAETRYSIALYYLVVTCLKDLKTDSSIDDILDPLRTRLPEVCSIVQSLFTKTQETLKNEQKRMIAALKMPTGDQRNAEEESINNQFVGMLEIDLNLDTFISNYALEIPRSTALHFAFYVVRQDGLPVSYRASRQYNSFDHRNPTTLAQLLHRTVVDPALSSQSSSNVGPSSEATTSVHAKLALPKIETTFAPGPSNISFLTTRNLSNFSPAPDSRSNFLSPSTARHAYHASLRTSQAGTAVCPSPESETTFAVSPQVFEEPDLSIPEPITDEEKKLDLDSLRMTQDKPGTSSKYSLSVKRPHSPDSDVSPSKRVGFDHMLNDMNTILGIQNFHENEFFMGWNEASGDGDATSRDAIDNGKILSSPIFSSDPVL